MKKKSNTLIIKILESFLGKGAYSILTILFTLICSRLYGAEVLGEFSYAFTIITILSMLAKLGLDNGLIYSMPKHKYKHVSFSFFANFVCSILIALLVWCVSDNEYLKLMLPIIWLYSVESLFFSLYSHEGKFKGFYFINGFLSMIIRIIVLVFLYYIFRNDTNDLIIAVVVSFIFSNVVYLITHYKKFEKIYFEKEILIYSFPLLLSNMTALLLGKTDLIMLEHLASNKDVGIFQVILQITGIISVVLTIFISVLAPKFSDLYHNSNVEELKLLYIKSTRVLFLISFIFTFITILSNELILNLFGSEFSEGQVALIYMCIGQFVNVAVGAVWTLMAMCGKPKFQMYANVLALVLNIILNAILIPKYGINGAGFASMITICTTNLIGYYVVKREFKVKVFRII